MKVTKKRNWAFLIYPDSMPDNWKEIFNLSGLQIAVSPLHDKDLNPDEEEKKPHYHVIVVYGNTTTYNNVLQFTKQLNGTIPKALESVRGYYRYLTHKDNPEKYQYDEKDIQTFGGFDILEFVELTKTQVNKIISELTYIIRDNDIFEYSDLIFYCLDNQLNDYFAVASNHTLYFCNLLNSLRNKKKEKEKND